MRLLKRLGNSAHLSELRLHKTVTFCARLTVSCKIRIFLQLRNALVIQIKLLLKQFDAVIVQAAGNALVAVQILRQVQRILHRFRLFRGKHR